MVGNDPRRRVYPITHGLWLGPFASPGREPILVQGRVTHVLNVGEAPSVLSASSGTFREIEWQPIVDLVRIPDEVAIRCLETLHRMVGEPETRVYVHCMAGWNRSPTVLWLYLVACGWDEGKAKDLITRKSPDAIPGHERLADSALIQTARDHGTSRFMPHPRSEAVAEWEGKRVEIAIRSASESDGAGARFVNG